MDYGPIGAVVTLSPFVAVTRSASFGMSKPIYACDEHDSKTGDFGRLRTVPIAMTTLSSRRGSSLAPALSSGKSSPVGRYLQYGCGFSRGGDLIDASRGGGGRQSCPATPPTEDTFANRGRTSVCLSTINGPFMP